MQMTDPITLTAGDWIAEVAPAIGGSLLSLTHNGEPILRPTPTDAITAGDVLQTAGYPMIPYANRIDHGRFTFAGAAHQLDTGFIGAPHSIHGVGWRRAWATQIVETHACTLALRHQPVGAADPDWPFAFDAGERFVLTPRGLTIRMTVTNLEPAPAPAGLGFHTFFPRRPGETLTFGSKGAWRNGPDMLPSAWETDEAWNYAGGRALGDHEIDNDFSGWGGLARMAAPSGATIRMRASRTFGVLRIYSPIGAGFFAAEPVSHLANAINRPELEDHAMTVLASGASLRGDIEIELIEAGH
jgi:aldose 1-epimerase